MTDETPIPYAPDTFALQARALVRDAEHLAVAGDEDAAKAAALGAFAALGRAERADGRAVGEAVPLLLRLERVLDPAWVAGAFTKTY